MQYLAKEKIIMITLIISLLAGIIVALNGLYSRYRSNLGIAAFYIGLIAVAIGFNRDYGILEVISVWLGYKVALTLHSNRPKDQIDD